MPITEVRIGQNNSLENILLAWSDVEEVRIGLDEFQEPNSALVQGRVFGTGSKLREQAATDASGNYGFSTLKSATTQCLPKNHRALCSNCLGVTE